jgi:hypothetical protein
MSSLELRLYCSLIIDRPGSEAPLIDTSMYFYANPKWAGVVYLMLTYSDSDVNLRVWWRNSAEKQCGLDNIICLFFSSTFPCLTWWALQHRGIVALAMPCWCPAWSLYEWCWPTDLLLLTDESPIGVKLWLYMLVRNNELQAGGMKLVCKSFCMRSYTDWIALLRL